MTDAPHENPLAGRLPGGTRWEATPIFDEILRERGGAPPGSIPAAKPATKTKTKRTGKQRPRARNTP
jgi:hypothetical protein